MAPGGGELHLLCCLVLCILVALVAPAAAVAPRIVSPLLRNGGDLGHTAQAGSSLTLKCEGDTEVTWDYSWMTLPESGKTPTQAQAVERGVHTASLELSDLYYRHVGQYTCRSKSCSDAQAAGCSASLYVFVKDNNNLLTESGVHFMSVKYNESFTIPCKPAFPGVTVTLTGADGREISPSLDDVRKGYHRDKSSASGRLTCSARYKDKSSEFFIWVNYLREPAKPWIKVHGDGFWQRDYDDVTLYEVLPGKNISLNCSNPQSDGVPKWFYNSTGMEGIVVDNDTDFITRLTIKKLQPQHSQLYECRTENHYFKSPPMSVNLFVVANSSYMKFTKPSNYSDLNLTAAVDITWVIPFKAYPLPDFSWLRDGEVILNTTSSVTEATRDKYSMIANREEGFVLLQITGPTMQDIGNHELKAVQHLRPPASASYKFHLIIAGAPESVSLVRHPSSEVVGLGSLVTITCGALGHPRPELRLLSRNCSTINNCSPYHSETASEKNVTCDAKHLKGCRHSLSETKVSWVVKAELSKMYICEASNDNGTKNSTALLLPVIDQLTASSFPLALSLQVNVLNNQREPVRSYGGSKSAESFERYEATAGQVIHLTCQANKMLLNANEGPKIVLWTNSPCQNLRHEILKNEVHTTELSVLSNVTISLEKNQKSQQCHAAYRCVIPQEGPKPSRDVKLVVDVLERIPSAFLPNELDKEYHKIVHDSLNLSCPAEGRPAPLVLWKKDDSLVMNEPGRVMVNEDEHTLTFEYLKASDNGKYTCTIWDEDGREQVSLSTVLMVTDSEAYQKKILIYAVIGITVLLVICSIIIGVKLVMNHKKLKKEREFQQQLFLNGDVDNLNPELDITEQADLLPYNKKYEFPRDNIVYEKLLGSGAFGRVYRAKAKGILQDEQESTVAVKMIKSRSDRTHLRALRSEIKIMMHIGRHLNIVNLLGACSADMASKGELCLIVEYCSHGNILTYMRQKKGTFVNQIGSDGRIISAKYGSLTSRGSLQRNGYMNVDYNSTAFYRSGYRRRTLSQSKTNSDGQARPPSRNLNNESPLSPSGHRTNSAATAQADPRRAVQNSPIRSPTYSNGSGHSPAIQSPRSNPSAHQAFTFDTVPEEIDHHPGSNPNESQQIQTPTEESPRRVSQTQAPVEQNSVGNGSSSSNGGPRLGSGSNPATATTYQTTQGGCVYSEKPGLMSDMTQVTQDCDSEAYITLGDDSLNSQRLLHWCYQIANGMEYLAARKVMHGDLAARNILLAENGVVKISDFGMAKDIYKDDQYTKTSKVPIPIKWMAIEALRDGVLSTQSDVWSYGVVMWEIFTLGQVPYPTIEINKNFVDQLESGTRLNRPPYATDELYEVMKMCWEEEPTKRPLFDKLAEYLGNMMEETDKQFYLNLNKDNAELWQSNSSILNKILSPDIRLFNNLDKDGYQMPKNVTMEVENSAQSSMSHRNIHGLFIQAPPTDEENGIEYLLMRTPTGVSAVNEHPATPGYYTHMSRSATPSRAIRSPMSIRSISTSPKNFEDGVFQFPSTAKTDFSDADPTRYSDKGASIDSGFYTPSLVGNFSNPEYYMPPSQETEFTENSPMLNSNRRPPPVTRQLSLRGEASDQQHRDYCNAPIKPARNRTTSETSSGLRSINENPSRESLLKTMGSSYPIAEESHQRLEWAV